MYPAVPRRALATALLLLSVTLGTPTQAGSPAAAKPGLPHVAARLAAGEPLRISAFGSSSTEGAGASTPAASYPSQLQRILASRLAGGVTVLNRGIGGEDADDMALRIPAIIADRPDLVVWQTGSNDPLRDVPLDRFANRTREGIAALRAAGIDVMLMTPQLCDRLDSAPDAASYRKALRSIGRENSVPVVRRFDLMQQWLDRRMITRAALLSTDGLHMADAGYHLLATEVAREILALAEPAQVAGLR